MDTNFYEQVYEIVRLIPRGRVTSYGAIAKSLGSAKSSRMVGHAMSCAGIAYPNVPAHRVVNSAGLLTGKFHFDTPEMMEKLLKEEGIVVNNDKIVNFSAVFWNPMEELG